MPNVTYNPSIAKVMKLIAHQKQLGTQWSKLRGRLGTKFFTIAIMSKNEHLQKKKDTCPNMKKN
jgi:hypothetical protein